MSDIRFVDGIFMSDSAFETGTVLLQKYRVEQVLGRGGMGIVLKARHIHLDEPVAIKLLHPTRAGNTDLLERFLREARAAVRLKGENICHVFDVGLIDDQAPYMVMEFMEGMDLDALVAAQGTLPPPLVADLVLQACAGLAHAHALGIVHRDIKPANLFVTTRADGTMLLKVLDFGIAKAIADNDSGLTNTQSILGTPAYMSPEQLRSSKHVDERTDIWALGVVMYELLVGQRPFQGDGFSAICLKIAMDPTPPLQIALPAAFQQIVQRCLHKQANARYQTIAELAWALAPHAQTPAVAERIVDSVNRLLGSPASSNSQSTHHASMRSPASTMSNSVGQVHDPAAPSRHPSRTWRVLAAAACTLLLASAAAFLVVNRGDRAHTADIAQPAAPSTIEPGRVSPIEPAQPPSSSTPDQPSPSTPDQPPSSTSDQPPPRPAMPDIRRIVLDSRPTGAAVLLDGQRLGETPYDIAFEPDAQRDYVLKKRGYHHARIALPTAADDQGRAFVVLQRRRTRDTTKRKQAAGVRANKASSKSKRKSKSKSKTLRWE